MFSLGALLIAIVPRRTGNLSIGFDFSTLRFGTAEVEIQLIARNDAC